MLAGSRRAADVLLPSLRSGFAGWRFLG